MSPILFEQILDHLFNINILELDNNTTISLYNWGDPFLNPEINNILHILEKNKVYADISSNFIVRPDIDKECIPTIKSLTFSLSGFSQDSYGKIHGASLNKTLSNFEDIYSKIRKYSPKTAISISWHRYLFNENEFWDALRYFNRPGIIFSPIVAFFNDILEMIEFVDGRLSEKRKKQAGNDLFVDHILRSVALNKQRSKYYRCMAWDSLVIDEIGQLLLCCGVTRYDSDLIVGNILEISTKEIWENKSNNSFCNKCLSSGIARWAYKREFWDKSWPIGGGLQRLYFPGTKIRSKLGQMLKRFPGGEKFIHMIKTLSAYR